MSSTEVMRALKAAGWTLDRVKGSHHHFRHPAHGNTVTVPHPKKDLGLGLIAAIEKQSGVNLR